VKAVISKKSRASIEGALRVGLLNKRVCMSGRIDM
jgi:hypothetical protein